MQNQFDPRTSTDRFGGVNPATVGVPRATRDAGLRSYMLSVYNYMASGVLLTGIVALLFASSGLAAQVLMTPLRWLIILAPLGFVMAMSFGVNRMQKSTLQMLFWAFAVTMGLSMSSIFLVYTGVSIAQTFFAVAAGFAGLSLYGYTTNKDLSGFGTFLVMGVVGLLVAMLINMFLQSPAMMLAISAIGVLAVRRPDGLRHTAHQEHVRTRRGNRDDGQGRDHGRSQPLSRLHQHVHVPAQLHGQSAVAPAGP